MSRDYYEKAGLSHTQNDEEVGLDKIKVVYRVMYFMWYTFLNHNILYITFQSLRAKAYLCVLFHILHDIPIVRR